MLPLERNGYSAQEVKNAIHGKYGSRMLKFRYDLLDFQDKRIGQLDSVQGGEVSMASLSAIHRTARFSLKDKGEINWLSDRIQPFALFRMRNGGFAEFPLGIFLLSSPTRSDRIDGIYRDVQAFDGTLVLKDDKFPVRHVVSEGKNYIAEVEEILVSAGITKINIQKSDKVLPTELTFEPGKEKLQAINELLMAINYTPIHVSVYGFHTSFPYRNPSERASEYLYKDDQLSILYPGLSEELDLSQVPNQFVVVRSNSKEEPIYSIYTNDNPHSPLSTVNRGRIIPDHRQIDEIADQQALDEYTERIAFEASQVYGKIEFETAINPIHDFNDVFSLEYSPLGINDKYNEIGWSIPLKEGARMRHTIQKVVSI